MLSEILFASIDTKKRGTNQGISCSQLFPCPYRLLKVHRGEAWDDETTPQQLLNMADGWDQEAQSIRRLKAAGIIIGDRQGTVSIGRARIPGHIDGTVTLNGKKRIWEHKAWNDNSYGWFLRTGIDGRPGEKAQINSYMFGFGLDEAIFMVENKNSNDYHDVLVKLDEPFIKKVLGWADRIILDGWEPEPVLSEYCSHCFSGCFGQVMDFSWMETAEAPEMVKKWKQGYQLASVGDMYMQEARTFFTGQVLEKGKQVRKFPGLIGDKDELYVEDLKIKKVPLHRFDIDKNKVLQELGPEGLIRVGVPKDIETFRISEV